MWFRLRYGKFNELELVVRMCIKFCLRVRRGADVKMPAEWKIRAAGIGFNRTDVSVTSVQVESLFKKSTQGMLKAIAWCFDYKAVFDFTWKLIYWVLRWVASYELYVCQGVVSNVSIIMIRDSVIHSERITSHEPSFSVDVLPMISAVFKVECVYIVGW